jgi:ectoine hydroxylase-related dioxygenase (phytanoyl-CoA dioxygenase family)
VCLDDAGERAVPAEARAGSIVVFSSLTPHATGPNRSSETRKAYIVQFAPDGARVFPRDASGRESESTAPVPANDPTRQYPLLVGGQPLAPPALAER